MRTLFLFALISTIPSCLAIQKRERRIDSLCRLDMEGEVCWTDWSGGQSVTFDDLLRKEHPYFCMSADDLSRIYSSLKECRIRSEK